MTDLNRIRKALKNRNNKIEFKYTKGEFPVIHFSEHGINIQFSQDGHIMQIVISGKDVIQGFMNYLDA